MRALNCKQLRVARSVAEALFDGGTGVPAERLNYTEGELAAFSRRMGWQSRLALGFALFIVSIAPWLLWLEWKRFTSLSGARRSAVMDALELSPFAMVVVLLKTLLSMVYFEHPDALAGTGYDAEGLLGPAYAPESPSPITKLRVLVAEPAKGKESSTQETPASAKQGEGSPALTPAPGSGAAGGS